MAGFNEKLVAAQSCNSDVENKPRGAKQDCADVVNISLYFDGTGNNDKVDHPLKRWSNPSRMFRSAARMMSLKGNSFAFYIAGVGTEYNGEATKWSRGEDKFTGEGFGGGGTRRTEYGKRNVNGALRQALLDKAVKINVITQEYAEKNKATQLADIKKTLGKYDLVRVINLSVFGFSRGAALARAFVNDFLKHQCTVGKDGKTYYNGYPVRIRFLGLFDTVASFGLPSLNVDTPFNEKNLVVPDCVERCVHFVAAHELRFSFPVDIIRKGGQYRANWTERVYPGVHSDVGGGYEPKIQGISNNYSRIPMRKMMNEAAKSGVRLMDYDELEDDSGVTFDELYAVLPDTESRFAAYIAAVKPPVEVEGAVTAHMKALYSGFGTMTRKKIKTPDLVATEGDKVAKYFGHVGIAKEAELLLDPSKPSEKNPLAIFGLSVHQRAGLAYGQIVRPEMWRLLAWQANCSDAIMQFVQHSVHDSKAGFLHSVEPFSYFRPRGMAESSRNVLARGMDWLDDTATAVREVTYKVIYQTGKLVRDAGVVVVETYHDGILIAVEQHKIAAKFVLEKTIEGARYTIEVVRAGHKVMIWTVEGTARFIVTSAEAVKKKSGELIDATQQKAGEAADAAKKNVGEFADATKKNVGDFADAAQKKGGEFADAVSKKTGQLVDSAGKSATELGQNIQSGASKIGDNLGQAYDSGLKAVENNWADAKSAFGF